MHEIWCYRRWGGCQWSGCLCRLSFMECAHRWNEAKIFRSESWECHFGWDESVDSFPKCPPVTSHESLADCLLAHFRLIVNKQPVNIDTYLPIKSLQLSSISTAIIVNSLIISASTQIISQFEITKWQSFWMQVQLHGTDCRCVGAFHVVCVAFFSFYECRPFQG